MSSLLRMDYKHGSFNAGLICSVLSAQLSTPVLGDKAQGNILATFRETTNFPKVSTSVKPLHHEPLFISITEIYRSFIRVIYGISWRNFLWPLWLSKINGWPTGYALQVKSVGLALSLTGAWFLLWHVGICPIQHCGRGCYRWFSILIRPNQPTHYPSLLFGLEIKEWRWPSRITLLCSSSPNPRHS